MLITELIERLERIAPKSCSKPKSEMCSKCIDRTTSDSALKVNDYLQKLRIVKNSREKQTVALIAEVTSYLMNMESGTYIKS
jgi:hypothetical protein